MTNILHGLPEGSLPAKLYADTLQRLIDILGLQEVTAADGGPYLPLVSQLPMVQGEVGVVRVFSGGPLFRVVTCSLTVLPIQLDSHMLFAFTPGSSAVPHFTLDAVKAGEHFAFHLDLIPRLDLGANLAYMDEVFSPLTPAYEAGSAIEGLSKAHLSPRQHAIMSPWMLANRASEEAFAAIETAVQAYQQHWFQLLEQGVSPAALEGVTAGDLAARNLRNKRIIFDPDVDPVWQRITAMIGPEAVAAQRALLIGEDE
ncbi:MAG: hypothetical protein KDI10_18425 [Halioglobus sp.]|nr:hypothetical protein [Halioglobus sp.]MCB1710688.1 hypothetical protein [Halioglobus sp.]MCP5121860.1 hypothetical protein [Pseudomonadales bacterium]MCP5192601.1 hypothetical protein [Pseudomonadales bacterium]